MEELYLVRPDENMRKGALSYRQEYIASGESWINGSLGLFEHEDYDEWLRLVMAAEKRETSSIGVPALTFFTVRRDDGRIVGTVQLRLELDEEFSKRGGNIGYGIRPSERGKGYGTEQLALVLDVARERGLKRVMITCGQDNAASAKTAESCGAVLEKKTHDEEDGDICIYWIELD